MTPRVRQRFEHARTEAAFAHALVDRLGDGVAADPVARRALERACEIVGEALRAIVEKHPTTVAAYPDVPWTEAIGLRTRLAHAYDSIDIGILIDTARQDFPRLIAALDAALGPERPGDSDDSRG